MSKYFKQTGLFFLLAFSHSILANAQNSSSKPVIGIVQNMEYDSLLTASGYEYLIESVQKCLSPKNVSDEKFEEILKTMKNLKIKLYGFNLFIPGELKLVGPEVNEAAILAYTEVVLRRCQRTGKKLIVLGSGGSRRVPEGFDKAKAREQFIGISRKIAGQAKKYDVIIALENLNSKETNFLNTLADAFALVRDVDHPNFRLNADIYHMLKENESPSEIEKAGAYIVHCDIAEREIRSAPGTKGDDFTAYLRALKKIGYHNKIIMEANWDNLLTRAEPAYLSLQKQINEVYDAEVKAPR